MHEKTIIAWTDHTFNPWMGCVKEIQEYEDAAQAAAEDEEGFPFEEE